MNAIIQNDNHETLATVPLDARQFKTGSKGFYGNGKVSDGNGKRYQATLILTEIGSKPVAVKPAPAKAK